MNQNNIMARLLIFKEQVHTFFQKRGKIAEPVIKGVITLIVLFLTTRLFPYGGIINRLPFLLVLSVLQAFLPLSVLYYIVSAVILCNLWNVSFDIFAAFIAFLIICIIGYFRIDARYSYLSVIVPLLFFLKLEVVIPAAIAILFGISALFPVLAGTLIYYFSFGLTDTYAMLSTSDSSGVGIGLQRVLSSLTGNQEFLVVFCCVGLAYLITCLVRKMFYERAWLVAVISGNVSMAFFLFIGRLFFEMTIPGWRILLETLLGIVICSIIEFFRGIGDCSRVEKTVFEDDEYIYYVKAVPKMKLAVSEPNIKIMNDDLNDVIEEKAAVEEPSSITEKESETELSSITEKEPEADTSRITEKEPEADTSGLSEEEPGGSEAD